MTPTNIVVTGATGNIGGGAALQLAASPNTNVIAFVRDTNKAAELERAGARLTRGTFEDASSMREAFADADTLLLNTSGETLADQAIAAIAAAREVGVRKIVRISSARATIDGPTESTRQHARADAALAASGLGFVILRPNAFMQNLLFAVRSLRDEGKIFAGTGAGKIGFIDARDIADAAAAASLSDAWNGQTLDLTGPASIDYDAVAAAIGKQIGRPITYVPVSPEAAGEAARKYGVNAWSVQAIVKFAAASAQGWGDYTTDNIPKLTGHPARSIEDFVAEVLAPAVRGG